MTKSIHVAIQDLRLEKTTARRFISGLLLVRRWLYIEIKKKFMGMRTEFHVIDLIIRLIFDPRINNILSEDIPFHHELVIFLEC
jgi:hypothetical protein